MPSVNRRGASDDVPLDFRACDRLLTDLVRHEQGWPFLRPVTRKEVAAYYEVVKRPVDFGTIRSRLNGMTYRTNKAFVVDVLLVFQNCCVINVATGPEYRAAEILGRFFLSRVRECGLGLRAEPDSATTVKNGNSSKSKNKSTSRSSIPPKASPVEIVLDAKESEDGDLDVDVDRLVEEAIVVDVGQDDDQQPTADELMSTGGEGVVSD